MATVLREFEYLAALVGEGEIRSRLADRRCDLRLGQRHSLNKVKAAYADRDQQRDQNGSGDQKFPAHALNITQPRLSSSVLVCA